MAVGGPPPVTIKLDITPLNCNGTGNTSASVRLTASNGVAPYRFEFFKYRPFGEPMPVEYTVENDSTWNVTGLLDPEAIGYQSYWARTVDSKDCPSDAAELPVRPLQDLQSNGDQQSWVCSGPPAALQFPDHIPGMNYVWFEDAEGTIPLDTAVAFSAPTDQPGDKQYYFANYSGGCYWTTGATTRTIVVSESGDYSVVIRDNDCESLPSAPTTITAFPLPASPTAITPLSANIQVTGTSDLYEWQLDGKPLQERTAIIQATLPGKYTVRGLSEAGCVSVESISYTRVVTGIESAWNDDLILYPNPSHGALFLEGRNLYGIVEISISNALGQVVLMQPVPVETGIGEINLHTLPPGVYHITIGQATARMHRTIIIR